MAATTTTDENTGPVPIVCASTPTAGPRSVPAIAIAKTSPITVPRRDSGAVIDQPRDGAGPGERPRHALHEARCVEQDDVPPEAERQARRPEQQEARDKGASRTDTGRHEARRQRGDQRARGVGGRQHAGRRLREPEVVHVRGQQRCDRRVEHDVEEDDGGADEEQPAHLSILPGPRSSNRPERCPFPRPAFVSWALQLFTKGGSDEVHAADPARRHPDTGIAGVGGHVRGRAAVGRRRLPGHQPDARA